MSPNDDYTTLAKALGYGGSEPLRKVLEHLMTPDQAKMATALPGTVVEVAEKTGFAPAMIQENLDSLFFDGVVFCRGDFVTREYFRFARSIGQLHDATLATQKLDLVKDREFIEAWQEICMQDWYPDMGKMQAALPTPPLRIVPSYKALEGIKDVLPCEDYRELMKAQDLIATVPCACRVRTEGIDEACEHTNEQERWQCFQFGRAADYVIKRGSGKKLSIEEAIEYVGGMEDDALLHIWPNSTVMGGIKTSCNCCRDCCANYVPMDMLDEPIGKVWEKSRFEAFIDQEKCDGCQDCIERCQFDAIELVKPEKKAKGKKAKKMKATVIAEKCWGCGVCVPGCKEAKAIGFKLVRPEEFIPGVASATH